MKGHELATSNRNADGKHGTRLPRNGDDIGDTLALNEVRETRYYWFRLILRAELIGRPDYRLNQLIDEAGEPVAILAASANTARRRERRGS